MHHLDLSTITIEKGPHDGRDGGCVMEWVAIFAGLDKTDEPSCTSPVLRAFAIAFNDGVDDEFRQRLVPFIPRLVGTAGDPEADERRAWMATDWLVRTHAPAWLRRAGLDEDADALAALPALTSAELAKAAQPIIDEAKRKAYAAGDAAWAAAGAAAWAAQAPKDKYDVPWCVHPPVMDEVLADTVTELREDALRLFSDLIDVRTAVAA